VTLADRQRGPDSFHEEFAVHLDPFSREHSHLDLGARVVETNAQESMAMVFQLNQITVGGGFRTALDGAGVNPRVSGNETIGFTRFHHQGDQRGFHFCRQTRQARERNLAEKLRFWKDVCNDPVTEIYFLRLLAFVGIGSSV